MYTENFSAIDRMNIAAVVPGTIAQLRDPFPVVGDFVQKFHAPKYPHLEPAVPIAEPKEAKNNLIRNPHHVPATKPHYGFPMPAKF